MARIRTIKPGFWIDEDLSALPESTHILAAALLNYADDDGYFNANPLLIKAACFPLREPSVSVQCMLTQLATAGYIRIGRGTDGKTYGQIVHFAAHQVINRKTESKIARIAISWEPSPKDPVKTHGVLREDSRPDGNKEGDKEGNKEILSGSDEPDPLLAKKCSRIKYSEYFEQFWKLYPTDPNQSKKIAFEAWCKLPKDDRQRAITAVPAFKTYCQKNPDYRPVHACRFLSQRRFDGFLEANGDAPEAAGPPPGLSEEEQCIWIRDKLEAERRAATAQQT